MSDRNDFPETPEDHLKQLARTLELMIGWGEKFADDQRCSEVDALLARARDVAEGKKLN